MFAHCVNTSLKIPPNISDFHEQYQKPKVEDEDTSKIDKLSLIVAAQQPVLDTGNYEGSNKDGYKPGEDDPDKEGAPIAEDDEFGNGTEDKEDEMEEELDPDAESAVMRLSHHYSKYTGEATKCLKTDE
ncbi:hypothetical protein BDV93DRAFT_507931 [Ceratobasidium sp. AG-I]|nr:hypothetical protein BDV93DRAFT_507931 [Ceratobasidium sp. AG-I]